MSLLSICVAGAESTGKSWLAHRLAGHFGVTPVKEYARAYCARHGNNLDMAQLVHVAQMQDAAIRNAVSGAGQRGEMMVIADTDAVVTAAWALVGHGRLDLWFAGDLIACDLTLVTENDLAWRDDGVRIQRDNAARDSFRATLIKELDRRNRRWVSVGGQGEARFANALRLIAENVGR